MILVKIKTNSNFKFGKGFWKLNCKLLDEKEVIKNFEKFVESLTKINEYDNILCWLVDHAKNECKRFFIKINTQKNNEKLIWFTEYSSTKVKTVVSKI